MTVAWCVLSTGLRCDGYAPLTNGIPSNTRSYILGPQIYEQRLYLVATPHVRFSCCDDIGMSIPVPYEHAEYVCESASLGDHL